MTDRAMTAVVGRWYSAVPEPVKATIESQAVSEFRAGFVKVRPGLAILPGVALEPRLTVDYRWGRLYSLTRAHPDTITLGVSGNTAIELNGATATVIGGLSVVSADGRTGPVRDRRQRRSGSVQRAAEHLRAGGCGHRLIAGGSSRNLHRRFAGWRLRNW